MKICNTCNNIKPLTEFGPHNTTIDGYNPKCKQCVSEYNREYRKKNRNRIRENDRKYAANHREEAKNRTREWNHEYSERKQTADKKRYQKNKALYSQQAKERHQRNKDANCQRSKQWRMDNPARVLAQIAKRRAAKKQAIPTWADISQIQVIYNQAIQLTEETGVSYQVDHIVPLNSNVVWSTLRR